MVTLLAVWKSLESWPASLSRVCARVTRRGTIAILRSLRISHDRGEPRTPPRGGETRPRRTRASRGRSATSSGVAPRRLDRGDRLVRGEKRGARGSGADARARRAGPNAGRRRAGVASATAPLALPGAIGGDAANRLARVHDAFAGADAGPSDASGRPRGARTRGARSPSTTSPAPGNARARRRRPARGPSDGPGPSAPAPRSRSPSASPAEATMVRAFTFATVRAFAGGGRFAPPPDPLPDPAGGMPLRGGRIAERVARGGPVDVGAARARASRDPAGCGSRARRRRRPARGPRAIRPPPDRAGPERIPDRVGRGRAAPERVARAKPPPRTSSRVAGGAPRRARAAAAGGNGAVGPPRGNRETVDRSFLAPPAVVWKSPRWKCPERRRGGACQSARGAAARGKSY